jgi:hypothetical protein
MQSDYLNIMIGSIKDYASKPEFSMITQLFKNGFPVVPFPNVERCLGLKPQESHLVIHDGYAVISYDFKVLSSDANCLFNMKENLA